MRTTIPSPVSLGIDPMSEWIIRPLSAEDLPALAEMERLCFSEPWSEKALSILLSPENVGVVALDGERVVAYGGMTTVLDEGSVTNVATHPDYRRRGLGREIVGALQKAAAFRGLVSVFLEARVSNEAARRLYEKMGFSVIGVRKGFYRHPAEDGLAMEWKGESPEKS